MDASHFLVSGESAVTDIYFLFTIQHTRIYSKTRSDESHHVHHAARPANCTAEIVSSTGAKSLFVASSAAPVRY